jgi:hypothetical protein
MMVNLKVKMHLLLNNIRADSSVYANKQKGSQTGVQLDKGSIEAARKTEKEIYKIYSDVTGAVYDGSGYSDCSYYPEVLRRLNLGTWETVEIDNGMFDAMAAATKDGYPIIALCHWEGGGGHFCCIDQTHTFLGKTISVCDPWDGEQRTVPASGPGDIDYDPSGFVFSTGNLLGGDRHHYERASKGSFDGWIVRKKGP